MKFIEAAKNKIQLYKAIKIYGTYYADYRKNIRSVLRYYVNKKNYNIAIWGAGLKGKAFLSVIDPQQKLIKYVYDIDEIKFGRNMPTGHTIVDYSEKYYQDIHVVLLMNNNYETEIASQLEEENLKVILINIDSIIAGELLPQEVVKMYRKERI